MFYPEDSKQSRFKPYRGVLFRYNDPEYLKIEVDKRSTLLDFSTDKSPEDAARVYQEVFGQRVRAQEVLNPNGEMDDTDIENTMSVGQKGFLLVALKAYRYAWVAPRQPFTDREGYTPSITINELTRPFDERNTYLITQLATPAVLADLRDTLPYVNSLK